MLLDGVWWSVMVGLGESWFPAFALALGLSSISSGWVSTLPVLLGAALQLATPAGLRRVGSARRWVVGCALVQAASLVPLAWLAVAQRSPAWLLFGLLALYWAAAQSANVAWTPWVGTLVPQRLRGAYFGARNRALQLSMLLAVLAAGWLLHEREQLSGRALALPFAWLFAAAAIARLASAQQLAAQGEPVAPPRDATPLALANLARLVLGRRDGRLLAAFFALQLAISIALPFTHPYLLRELGQSYPRYTALVAAAYLGKGMVGPWMGAWAARRGAGGTFAWIALALAVHSALWLVSADFGWLLLLQWCGGALIGAWELALFLRLFEVVELRDRAAFTSLYGLANAAAVALGSLLGGLLLSLGGAPAAGYALVFAASACARLLPLPWLLGWRRAGPHSENPVPDAAAAPAPLPLELEAGPR